ncbi:ankyrin repeat domain-containing protein [Dysgonomonas sp. 25]|uniref:ankyrin repeat domain-containing protein n=1 Tax=Dysgonomonas sp. 25 TaxID=2302933 RepID=UPI0013CF871A|nr:ankyrin repeat domain-containing protein [Dysgonomonas sp. 25]NDV68300.1 ankyrin repeat domain-containing protein [Dysgonomonas sp. 25]
MAKKKIIEAETFTNEMKVEFLNCDTVEKLRVFLNNYEIDNSDKFGNNILHYYLNNTKSFALAWNIVIPEILNTGLDIDKKQSKGEFGRTSLHIAIIQEEKDIAKYLIHQGANIDAVDANGNSLIWTAVMKYNGDGYFIEMLIKNGADVYLENNYEVSAIDLAKSISNKDVAKYFDGK